MYIVCRKNEEKREHIGGIAWNKKEWREKKKKGKRRE